jgi:hypothetical protein
MSTNPSLSIGESSKVARARPDDSGMKNAVSYKRLSFLTRRNCVDEAIADGKENVSCEMKEPVAIPDAFAALRAMANKLLAIHTGI